MTKYRCLIDNTYFNNRIYNYGDECDVSEEEMKNVHPSWFQKEEEFLKEEKKVNEKITVAKKEGKTVDQVIKENEKEKKEMKMKIDVLEEELLKKSK